MLNLTLFFSYVRPQSGHSAIFCPSEPGITAFLNGEIFAEQAHKLFHRIFMIAVLENMNAASHLIVAYIGQKMLAV